MELSSLQNMMSSNALNSSCTSTQLSTAAAVIRKWTATTFGNNECVKVKQESQRYAPLQSDFSSAAPL